MRLRQFDTAAWIILALVFGFSDGVATGWDWFADPDNWGSIANITPSIFSYLALALPLIPLLAYSNSRRKLFKDAGWLTDHNCIAYCCWSSSSKVKQKVY